MVVNNDAIGIRSTLPIVLTIDVRPCIENSPQTETVSYPGLNVETIFLGYNIEH